jgi:hypothetical protein
LNAKQQIHYCNRFSATATQKVTSGLSTTQAYGRVLDISKEQ